MPRPKVRCSDYAKFVKELRARCPKKPIGQADNVGIPAPILGGDSTGIVNDVGREGSRSGSMSEGDEEFGDYVAQEEVEGQRNEQNGESGRVETSLPQFYKSPPSDDGRQTNEEEDSQASDEVEGSVTQDTDQLSSSSEVQRPPLSDDGVAPDSLPSRQHSRNPSLQSNNLAFSPSSAINATPGTPDSTRSSSLLVHSLDKRFKTRLNELSDSRAHSRSSSTSTLAKHLRSTSQHSSIDDLLSTGLEDSETSTPWEAIRWTKLRKLSNQLYSENAMRSYGSPTVVLPSSTIAVGTSKGVVLCFDYHQSLKTVLTLKSGRTLTPGGGNVVSSDQLGHVTSLAVSADQTYIGAGYSTGYIITWELAKPSTPNLQIPPIGSDFLGKPKYDGHLEGSPVLHLNFCGKRHSMLVSGDVRGMAFSHNAVRSIMGRTVKTRRVLGRYPQNSPSSKRKPTSVLALACQPLGTEMQPSDEICLVAIMTPYMLALISTVPSPQTQYKIDNKEKETNLEMGLSACLAWFPVLKTTNGGGGSTPKLAYCWSNVVNVVEVESTKDSVTETVSVNPKFTKKFVCDESVVSIQWASRHILILVTITQRLLVVNEHTMAINSTTDLLNKHIMHHDYFSKQLKHLTLRQDDYNNSQSVAVADGYFNSFRCFKGRVFLLGNYEFVVGSLSNWADRLLDVMETGDYVKAIRLATSYYLGQEDVVVIGLPSDDVERHKLVEQNLPDMIFASLKYTFNRQENGETEVHPEFLRELTDVCIVAAVAIGADTTDLLSTIFEFFEASENETIFFSSVVSFISGGEITQLPPNVFKRLVLLYAASPDLSDKLEELICSLDTSTLDLDLTLSLCREYRLRDTQIYIWNHALGDFTSPLVDLVELMEKAKSASATLFEKENLSEEIEKAYPYLSYVLTGRVYPTGLFMEEEESFKAKCSIYHLLFSSDEYYYLSKLVEYDCAAFFSALNEAFEDSFLNDNESSTTAEGNSNNSSEIRFGMSVNRQLIINILLDLFKQNPQYPQDMKVFLNIFVARNYPKYSQFLILPGAVLSNVLNELCYYNEASVNEECELAIQSLLSKYKPPDLEKLISILYEVHAYRVLKFIFRSEKRYAKLLEVSFKSYKEEDVSDGRSDILKIVSEVLNHTTDSKERLSIENQLLANFDSVVVADTNRAVDLFSKHVPQLHESIFKLKDHQDLQYYYLRHLFALVERGTQTLPDSRFRNLYITLLIKRSEFSRIHHLLTTILTGRHDVDLPSIVDDLIESRAIDILSLLLERQGRISEAMIYVINHLLYLDEAYSTVVKEIAETEHDLSKYVYIGMGLCQSAEENGQVLDQEKQNKSVGEHLWTRLIDTLVDLARTKDDEPKPESLRKEEFRRRLLREALSGLLESSGRGDSPTQRNEMVVRIFKSILYPHEPKLRIVGTVRPILNDLFSAYRYQYTMLSVAKQLLDNDTYEDVLELLSFKLRGWKVSRNGECEGCGRKVIGVGIDAEWLYEQWEEWQQRNLQNNSISKLQSLYKNGNGLSAKAKGKKPMTADLIKQHDWKEDSNVLVVFKCGHTYHSGCLKNLGTSLTNLSCVVCDSS